MTTFYIADAHFGHENIIRFEDRPFDSVGQMNAWMTESWNARLVIDDTFLPRALLDALAEGYDPGLDANEAIANADGLSWHAFPEFEFYGESFYTAEGFRSVVSRFRAESGQDIYCLLMAGELEKVAGQAEELGLGVMVTGP